MKSEIQHRADFSSVRYALCWEDPDLLVAALRPAGLGHCLSIGSAGDNSFALLAAGAGRVTVVELNPAQIACLELRKACYLTLEHHEFLQLLGLRPSAHRESLYRKIRDTLPEIVRRFWDARPEVWSAGPAHAGKFERYFRIFRRCIVPLAHSRREVAALFERRDRAERERFHDQVWSNRRWRAVFAVFFSRTVMGALGRDPEFFRYVQGSVADRILERVRHALVELDPATNPFLHMILRGDYGPVLPAAFQEENFAPIRDALRNGKMVIREGALEAIAPDSLPPVDGFNLSDIFEYMGPEAMQDLLHRLLALARPGARLAYWNMLAPRSRPEGLAARLRPLEDEARELFLRDRAFFYSRFVIEEVRP